MTESIVGKRLFSLLFVGVVIHSRKKNHESAIVRELLGSKSVLGMRRGVVRDRANDRSGETRRKRVVP